MDDDDAGATVRQGKTRPARAPLAESPRYVPIREIARGGMGRVIEALDTQLQRTVALKEILDEHPDARARFDREVEITARLEHPSIVPLYDAGTTASGAPFYVMRKVAGEPLAELIRDASTLDHRLRLLPHVLAVADAVAHAHARGVIHRDLKPTNVLVGELGETVVIDWGLAKLIGESEPPLAQAPERSAGASLHTRAGTVFGTPGFMPPEQLRGEPVDERADVYALGGCLYHVLAGKRPDDEPRFELEGAPTELVTIVKKAMAAERSARYLDAGGFSEDLRRFLGGQLVAAHHYPLSTRIGRFLRRHRALVAVIALALVMSATGAIVSLRRIFAEQARAEGALAREQQRVEDLLLFKASAYLATNPTLAAATLQQLPPESPRWNTLDGMLAGIRVRGVAYGYPGAGTQFGSVALSPIADDDRILTSGRGIARVINPVARTVKLLSDDADVVRALWWRGKVVVRHARRADRVIDPMTGAELPRPWPETMMVTAFADDGTVFYAERSPAVFMITPSGARARVELPEVPNRVECDPTGRWLAAIGATRVYVLRMQAPDRLELVFDIALEKTPQVAFDRDRRFVVGGGLAAVEYDLTVEPPAVLRRWTTDANGFPRYVRGDLHWVGLNTVRYFADREPVVLSASHGLSPEAELTDHSALLVDPTRIDLRGAYGFTMHAPEPVYAIDGRPGGRFFVAIGASRTFVWDMREVAAKQSALPAIDTLSFAQPDRLFGTRQFPRQIVRELRISTDRSIEPVGDPRERTFDWQTTILPTDTVFATNPLAGQAELVRPTRAAVTGVPGVFAMAQLDATTLVASTHDGLLYAVDRSTGVAGAKLAEVGFPVVALASREGWLLAIANDGRAWRRAPQGAITTARFPAWISPVFASDGTLYVGRGRELIEWPPAGEPAVLGVFPHPLATPAILHAGDRHLVIATNERALRTLTDLGLHRVDRQTRVITPLLTTVRAVAVAATGRIVAWTNDKLVVADASTGESYRFADAILIAPGGLAISEDGTTIVASSPLDQARVSLTTWRIERTDRAWLEQATNAIVPDRIDQTAIRWR